MGSIEAPQLEIPVVGSDTKSGNRSTLNSFTLMFQKLRLPSYNTSIEATCRHAEHRCPVDWLIGTGSMLAPPTLKVLRCDDVVPGQHVIMPVLSCIQRPERPCLGEHVENVRSIHLLPRFQICLRAEGQRAKGAKGQSMGNSNWNTIGTEWHG